ncbi:MAG: glutamate racemase [Patescibacteria group bacterium]|jgi:glutamate racemase
MIGIFDSGIGGLTVAKEILRQLPGYQLVYFGDTARTPYGNKSPETIARYAHEDIDFLLHKGAKIIVVACNTASAVAADKLKEDYPYAPIFEVITPAVKQAVAITKNKRIGVIGTRATVASSIYENKIKEYKNGFKILSQACPLFVPLAEEGWIDKPVTKLVAKKYLYSLKMQQIDTLILGCTHYPLLKKIIQEKIGKRTRLVDPAEEVVKEISHYLKTKPELEKTLKKGMEHQFYFSDVAPHLSELANKWLGQKIKPELHSI